MRDERKRKADLIRELQTLRKRVAQLEQAVSTQPPAHHHQSSSIFQIIFDESLDGLLVVENGTGLILKANRALDRILGYLPQELLGQHFSILFPTATLDASTTFFENISTVGPVFTAQPFLRADGSVCPVDVTVTLIPWERHYAALVTLRDATERQEAAQALEASQARFHHMITSIRDHIYVTEVLNDHQRLNRYISPNVEALTGYPATRFEKEWDFWPTVVIHPEDQYLAAAQMARFLDGEESDVEYRIIRADGDICWVRDSARAAREGGSLMIYGIVSDITEQKRLQIQLHQSQKMEAIGQLAGGVAHDFNNLLVVISGYSELLLGRILEPDMPSYRFVSEIQKAGERATALVKQLLVISRRQVVQPETIDLNQIIQGMESLLKRLIGVNTIMTLKLNKTPTYLNGAPSQLEQVILNLVVNARDAMQAAGTVTLKTRHVSVSPKNQRRYLDVPPGRYVELQVIDTGIGIDEQTLARIFDPFFTTKDYGTGLGLATVHGIVKQLGGHIQVQSKLNHGTTFTILLPRIEEPQLDEVPDHQERPTNGSETILLVEDEKNVRELTREILTMSGYKVLPAPDADEALIIFQKQKGVIDLLLTDVVMPGRYHGRQLAEMLQADYHDLKVIYMSGYADNVITRDEAYTQQVNFLQKPFSPRRLIQFVREVLDQKEAEL